MCDHSTCIRRTYGEPKDGNIKYRKKIIKLFHSPCRKFFTKSNTKPNRKNPEPGNKYWDQHHPSRDDPNEKNAPLKINLDVILKQIGCSGICKDIKYEGCLQGSLKPKCFYDSITQTEDSKPKRTKCAMKSKCVKTKKKHHIYIFIPSEVQMDQSQHPKVPKPLCSCAKETQTECLCEDPSEMTCESSQISSDYSVEVHKCCGPESYPEQAPIPKRKCCSCYSICRSRTPVACACNQHYPPCNYKEKDLKNPDQACNCRDLKEPEPPCNCKERGLKDPEGDLNKQDVTAEQILSQVKNMMGDVLSSLQQNGGLVKQEELQENSVSVPKVSIHEDREKDHLVVQTNIVPPPSAILENPSDMKRSRKFANHYISRTFLPQYSFLRRVK